MYVRLISRLSSTTTNLKQKRPNFGVLYIWPICTDVHKLTGKLTVLCILAGHEELLYKLEES